MSNQESPQGQQPQLVAQSPSQEADHKTLLGQLSTDSLSMHRLVDIKELKFLLAFKSEATLYKMLRTDEGFPKPKRIGPRCSRWVYSEVIDYIDSLPRADIYSSKTLKTNEPEAA